MKSLTSYELSVLLDFFHGKEVVETKITTGCIKYLLKYELIIDRRVGYSITDKGKNLIKTYENLKFD